MLLCRDKSYHLEPLLHGGSTLEVLGGGLDVVLDGLLREIDHVGREQGLAVLLEILLISVKHAVQPGQQLLGAVVGVQDNGDAVCRGNGTDVVSGGNGALDGGGLVLVVNALTGEVGGTTLRGLQDDGRLGVAGGLERGNNSGRRGHVDGRDGVLVLASVLEEGQNIITDDDTGLPGQNVLGTRHFVDVSF